MSKKKEIRTCFEGDERKLAENISRKNLVTRCKILNGTRRSIVKLNDKTLGDHRWPAESGNRKGNANGS